MKPSLTWLLVFYVYITSAQDTPKPVTDIPVNTKSHESAFSISGDGRTAVFVSDKKLYICTLYGSAWGNPKPLKTINDALPNRTLISSTNLSYDGNTLYFSANFVGGYGQEDIYYSVREYGEWSPPINIGEPINTALYEGYPCISKDRKKLYFARETFKKNEVESCYEIWVASRTIGENWGALKKLPSPINGECEKNPRILNDGKALIFSSLRNGGKGGFDFYESELLADDTWTEPSPLEFINSSANEDFISISGDNEILYIERSGDIFSVYLPKNFKPSPKIAFNGMVLDSINKKPISVKLSFQNQTRGTEFTIHSSPEDGSFHANLDLENNYILLVSADNIASRRIPIDLNQLKDKALTINEILVSLKQN